MSVLGSQVDVDMEECGPDPVPKHQGHTGTGCYKLHDHEFIQPRHRQSKGGGGGGAVGVAPSGGPPTNLMDLPVNDAPHPVQLNATKAIKHAASSAQRTPVSVNNIFFI